MEVIKSQRRLFLQPVVLQGLFFEQLFQEQHWFCLQFMSPVTIFKLEEVAVGGEKKKKKERPEDKNVDIFKAGVL